MLSLREIRSGDVLVEGAALVEEETGVHRADADLVHAEIKVWTRQEVGPEPLLARLTARGIDAVAAPGQGSYLPPPGFAPGADARILTAKGEDLDDLAPFAVPGKVTVFDFYADWCAPCRMLDGQLRYITSVRSDVAVRKLNIVDFNSALANHFARGSIPLVVIFNRSGRLMGELRGSDPRRIVVAIGRATASKD